MMSYNFTDEKIKNIDTINCVCHKKLLLQIENRDKLTCHIFQRVKSSSTCTCDLITFSKVDCNLNYFIIGNFCETFLSCCKESKLFWCILNRNLFIS